LSKNHNNGFDFGGKGGTLAYRFYLGANLGGDLHFGSISVIISDSLGCEYQLLVFWLDSARKPNPGLPTFSIKITKFYCSIIP